MAKLGKSWIRVHCGTCKERRTFVLQDEWMLECSDCGNRKSLNLGMFSREDAPKRAARTRVNFTFA